jgi:NADPH:quinone reductase-like Zn-dependent oxidoreductase
VHAATVNATDPIFRQGKPFIARFFSGLTKPKDPIIGNEFAGEIEAVGGDVKRFKPGDQVFGQTGLGYGTYAEYICLPEEEAIVTKPANMTYEEAATLPDGALGGLVFLRKTSYYLSSPKIDARGT